MPLRLLSYITRVYEKTLSSSKSKLYSSKGLTIPRPEFIILYNGVGQCDDTMMIKLSDAFADASSLGVDGPPNLELVARVYNINDGHNTALLEKSNSLKSYAVFVAKVREFEAEDRDKTKKAAIAIIARFTK